MTYQPFFKIWDLSIVTLCITLLIRTLLKTLLIVTLWMALIRTLLMSLYNLSIIAVADPVSSEGGARNMKYKLPRSVAIFFMTIFYRPGEGGAWPPCSPWIRY